MAFGGKRGATSGQDHGKDQGKGQAGDAQVTQQRVFPDEVWQGKTGDLLRKIGMSPDDESNLVPSWDQINAKIARDRGRHEARHAEVAREVAHKTGGGRVRPFFLIPDPVWNGDARTFLMMQLELSPYDDWNVLFLPDDARIAATMNVPVHPNGSIPAFIQAADDFMRQAEARLNAAHAEADRTHQFAAYGQAKNDIKDEVRGLAAQFANKLREGWMQSR